MSKVQTVKDRREMSAVQLASTHSEASPQTRHHPKDEPPLTPADIEDLRKQSFDFSKNHLGLPDEVAAQWADIDKRTLEELESEREA